MNAPVQAPSFWWEKLKNIGLKGNFAPIPGELEVDDLEVIGEIPKDLDGFFLRNGPNQQLEPPGNYHPFDGDGMVHAVRFKNGKASYKNRWVVSRQLAYERKLGRGVYYGMKDGFKLPEAEHAARAGLAKNVANINIVAHGGRLLAVSENGPAIELDRDLNTRGTARFGGEKLPRFTGHPHRLPDTDEMVAFAYSTFAPYFRYYLIDSDGTIETNDVIDISDPVMIHDICIAGEYAIFLDAPAILDFANGLSGGDVMSWKPERVCRFGVLPIRGRGWDVKWFEVDPCYIYHYWNGHQDGDKLVFYAERYDEVTIDQPEEDAPKDSIIHGRPARFTIDLKNGGRVKVERLSERGIVLPTIDPRNTGKKSRYGYGLTFDEFDLDKAKYIARVDLENGHMTTFDVGEGNSSSEVSYIANPKSPREEDGYLVGFVFDAEARTSECQLFRAADVAQGPIARIKLPQRVPHGFHGCWVPAWEL